MSNDHHSTSNGSQTQPGPDLLTERTLTGIFVHLLGLGTWFVLPAAIYLGAEHDFTRENARNAFNWQLLFTSVSAGLLGLFGIVLTFSLWIPENTIFDQIGPVFGFLSVAAFFALMAVMLINIVFGLIATSKAIFGSAWEYPLTPDFISWFEDKTDGPVSWSMILVGYATMVPIAFAYLFWSGITESVPGFIFAIGFVLIVLLSIMSAITPAVLVRDARANHKSVMNWAPYVGGPLAVASLIYVLTAVQFGSENPLGNAIYTFAGTFWLATIVYLIRQH